MSLWANLYQLGLTVVRISQDQQQQRAELKEMREDIQALTLAVARISEQVEKINRQLQPEQQPPEDGNPGG